MPRMSDHILDGGDAFPQMTFNKVGGGKLSLPGDLSGQWSVVLFYRGSW